VILALVLACSPEPTTGWWVDLHGRLVDPAARPLVGAEARFVTMDGAELARVTTAEDGTWHLPVLGSTAVGNELQALFQADGHADLRAHLEIDVRSPETVELGAGPWESWQTWERRVPTLTLAQEADVATATGRVVGAVDGVGVEGLPLTLQQGWNAPVDDPVVWEGVTGPDGEFAFVAWPAGWYTVAVAPSADWDPARFPAFLTGAGGQATGVVSPHVPEGSLRATLVWGEAPLDLDLHLSAPLKGGQAGEDGNGQFHVWVGEPTHPAQDPGGDGYEAELERSDADGTGPETVFVRELASAGELRLSALDASNLADPAPTELAASGAVIQLWNGSDRARFFTISPGETATLWRPFELDVATGVVYAAETYAVGVNPGDADAF